jgi:hypothetical protein
LSLFHSKQYHHINIRWYDTLMEEWRAQSFILSANRRAKRRLHVRYWLWDPAFSGSSFYVVICCNNSSRAIVSCWKSVLPLGNPRRPKVYEIEPDVRTICVARQCSVARRCHEQLSDHMNSRQCCPYLLLIGIPQTFPGRLLVTTKSDTSSTSMPSAIPAILSLGMHSP